MANKTKSNRPKNFKFKKYANIGAYDALEDQKFLADSFVDRGELSILRDTANPQCIILGRTGSGKTALIQKLETSADNVIKISPDALALNYISNNEILRFFLDIGVDMDLFYRLLWRHVFTIELIKVKFNIVNEKTRDNFLAKIRNIFQPKANKIKEEAIDYLVEWGQSFWRETDYRVREITSKVEEDLKKGVDAALEGVLPGFSKTSVQLSASSAKSLSEEKKAEVKRIGQDVIDRVQMKKLSEIINMLNEDILTDRQKKYYILIDRLDEKWINDDFRFQLIRALLEATRDFNSRLSNVKIVIAIREDLLDRVFRYTRDHGYQEEKYKSMYLPLSWTPNDLEELLDRRINQMVKEQYTDATVRLRDIITTRIMKNDDPVDYIVSRTMLRPRDAISFINECIKCAEGKPTISQENITTAELGYSENRLRALADEWYADYQNLIEITLMFLKKYPRSFKLSYLDDNKMIDFMEEFLSRQNLKQDEIFTLIEKCRDEIDIPTLIKKIVGIFYKVGVIGVKPESYTKIYWSYQSPQLLDTEFTDNTEFHVHPAFWRVVGIRPENDS